MSVCSDLFRGSVASRVCCLLRAAAACALFPWNGISPLFFCGVSTPHLLLTSRVDLFSAASSAAVCVSVGIPHFCSAIAPSVRRVGHARHAEAPLDRFERLVFTGREQDSILDRQVAVFRLQLLLSRFLAGLFQLHCFEKARALVRCS